MLDLVNLMWPDCPAQSATMGSAWRSARPGLFVPGKAWGLVHRGAASSGGRRISLKEIDASVSRRLGRGRVRGNSQATVFRRENCYQGLATPETWDAGQGQPYPASQDLRLGLVSLESHPNHQLQNSGIPKGPGTRLRQAAETSNLGATGAAATLSGIIDCQRSRGVSRR